MSLCDVVDKLHDEYGLSYAGAAEEAYLSALHVGFEQVNDLDASGEHLFRSREFFKFRSLTVYGVRPFLRQA